VTADAERSLAPSPPPREDPLLAEAESRRLSALKEVDLLDDEVERLAAALADFSRRYEAELSRPFADLAGAERLVRRLQELADELARLSRIAREPPRGKRERQRRPPPGRRSRAVSAEVVDEPAEAPPPDRSAESLEPPDEVELKRLRRRLARMFHPDLASDGADRQRLSLLMARVNEAYARGDRAALELLAERAGAADLDHEISPAERIAHAQRRAEALLGIAAGLRRERDRLRESATARLWEEWRRKAEAGQDLLAEMRREVEGEAADAHADGRARLDTVFDGAAALGRLWRSAMTGMILRKRGGGLRPFDPLAESPLVRRGVLHLDRVRAGARARDLARRLEESAQEVPWESAAVLLAFFAEAARRPPESLATPAGWRQVWEAIRRPWPDAPDFEGLLAHLPRQLELGIRAREGEVVAGLQLSSGDLSAGVRIALEREPVARRAREVLAALGPRFRCARCRRERIALHLLRTRGLDEVHGLACPGCGALLRSYWRYGEAEGLEALAPLALELGLVAEQVVSLGGTAIGFQMIPSQRESLTAAGLRGLFRDLYLAPCGLEGSEDRLRICVGKRRLAGSARVPQRGVAIEVGSRGSAELADTLRARIASRFRSPPPDSKVPDGK